jgi:uncharacterized protein (DUF885 family)
MQMMRAVKWLLGVLAAVIAAAGLLAAHTWYGKPLSINWFYNRVFLQFAINNPELLTQIRLFEQVGIRGHNGELADESIAHEDKTIARLKANRETFKRYDASAFKGQDRISHEVFDYFTTTQVAAERWRFHSLPISQHFGLQSNLPSLLTQTQQVNDAKDAAHYIARLDAFPTKFQQVLEGLREREKRDILPQRFVVDKVITQMKSFIGGEAKRNPLVTELGVKLAKVNAMSADDRAEWLIKAETSVAKRVVPAYQSLIAYFESLQSKVSRNDGAWAWPDGEAFYQFRIEEQTTTKLKADEIHQLGLADVARLTKEMDAALQAAGYKDGSVAQRVQAVAHSAGQIYPDSEQGRADILRDYQSIIDEISKGLDPYFSMKPKAGVVVKRVEPFAEKEAASAYYQSPPMDGSKPGTFYANLRDLKEQPQFSMRTLSYHEAVPGHHFQIAIAQELQGLPMFRSLIPFTAYAEGWALYAERLAWEMGYQKDPLDNLGRLRDEMFRAVRLVVDTGLHSKRWTRERAIAYMMEKTGMPESEVATEIERYLVDPAQALAYKVGMIKILELRERAKVKLGDRFDIREFHATVLQNGALPLAVLERVVDESIAEKLARK